MAHVERRRREGRTAWRARYRAPDGRERSKTFPRRTDAERFLTTIEASKLRGDWIDPVRGRITFREWSERYFAHALHKRPTTLARDHSVTEKHLLPAIGERRLASLTPLERPRFSLSARAAASASPHSGGTCRGFSRPMSSSVWRTRHPPSIGP